MAVNYDKLWQILSQRGISRTELHERTGITTNILTKMARNESVHIEYLGKICCLLECGLDDIVDFDGNLTRYLPVPNLSFSEFESWREYDQLGYSCINDFPKPISRTSIQRLLAEHLASCKLSVHACDELRLKLFSHGIVISPARSIQPDLSKLPQHYSDPDEDDLEHAQIRNYIFRVLEDKVIHQNWSSKTATRPSSDILVEDGHISTDPLKIGASFNATSQKFIPSNSIYPYNLLMDYWGDDYYFIIYEDCIDEMISSTEKAIHDLPAIERWLIEYIYKRGLSLSAVWNELHLPNWDTIQSFLSSDKNVMAKTMRKLRHPSRAKHIRAYLSTATPTSSVTFALSSLKKNAYLSHIDEMRKKLHAKFVNQVSLVDALEEYYDYETTQMVLESSENWTLVPDISIDTMNLGWKSRYALQHAQINTLKELRVVHGISLAHNNAQDSGLQTVKGLSETEISEILQCMGEFPGNYVDPSKTAEIIHYAETLQKGENEFPDIVCAAMPNDVLNILLHLKYRSLAKVVNDYKSGLLSARLDSFRGDRKNRVLAVISHFSNNSHPAKYVTRPQKDCLTSTLLQTPSLTLEQIRHSYLENSFGVINANDLEKVSEALFACNPVEYVLLSGTRVGYIRWYSWVFDENIIEEVSKQLKENLSTIDCTFYWGHTYQYPYNLTDQLEESFLLIKHKECADNQYRLFHFGKDFLQEVKIHNLKYFKTLYDAVSFSEQFSNFPENIDAPIRKRYCNDMVKFCSIHTNESTPEIWSYTVPTKPTDLYLTKNPKPLDRIYALTIEELDLTVRTFNVLKRANVETVGEMMKFAEVDYMRMRNMGTRSLEEIKSKLSSLGLSILPGC